MLQKTLNLVKEQRIYGLFYIKGFMFGDRFIEIVFDFEIKLFFHCCIFISKKSCRLLVGTPIDL
jgi:hypothetical protein